MSDRAGTENDTIWKHFSSVILTFILNLKYLFFMSMLTLLYMYLQLILVNSYIPILKIETASDIT